jgi:DNA-binding LacI/PurR family transcriptional regulator
MPKARVPLPEKSSRPVTLAQVAERAGVSKMTVSRAVNRDPRVSTETNQAIQKAIKELGFVPRSAVEDGRRRRSRSRRGLHQGRIAALIPDTNLVAMQTPLTGRLIAGIDRAINQHQLQMMVSRLPAPGVLPNFFNQRQIDGVIVRDGHATDWVTQALLAQDLPSVWIFGCEVGTKVDVVDTDDAAIGHLAAAHLLSNRHQRVLVLDDYPFHPKHRSREHHLRNAILAAGGTCETILLNGLDPARAIERVLQAIPEGKPAPGIFTPGTGQIVNVCVEVVRLLALKGMRIGLVACENDPDLASRIQHPMANFDLHGEALGEAAVELLVNRLANPSAPPRTMTIEPTLVQLTGA